MTLIAQLSDTHIREDGALAYGRVDTAGFMRSAVAHLNGLRPRPDLVVVSGDLVDLGGAGEYDAFNAIIAALDIPWAALPGNHDGPLFWSSLNETAAGITGERDCRAMVINDVVVLLADTTSEGASHGEIDAARAGAIDRALGAAVPAPVLLFMHHPPFATGITHMDAIGLSGIDRLEEVLSQHSHCLGIACGHVHRLITTRLGIVPVTIAPSPAHAVSLDITPNAPSTFHLEPPGVLLHRIEHARGEPRLTTYLSHIGTYPGPFPFFSAAGELLA